jgi:hypothetical protein
MDQFPSIYSLIAFTHFQTNCTLCVYKNVERAVNNCCKYLNIVTCSLKDRTHLNNTQLFEAQLV